MTHLILQAVVSKEMCKYFLVSQAAISPVLLSSSKRLSALSWLANYKRRLEFRAEMIRSSSSSQK